MTTTTEIDPRAAQRHARRVAASDGFGAGLSQAVLAVEQAIVRAQKEAPSPANQLRLDILAARLREAQAELATHAERHAWLIERTDT